MRGRGSGSASTDTGLYPGFRVHISLMSLVKTQVALRRKFVEK